MLLSRSFKSRPCCSALSSIPCSSALHFSSNPCSPGSRLVSTRTLPLSAWFQLVPSRLAPGLRAVRLNSAFGPDQHDPAQRLVSTHAVQPSALTLARVVQLHFGFSQRLIPVRATQPNLAWADTIQQGIGLARCGTATPLVPQVPRAQPLLGFWGSAQRWFRHCVSSRLVAAFPHWAHPEVEQLVCLALKLMPIYADRIGATPGMIAAARSCGRARLAPVCC